MTSRYIVRDNPVNYHGYPSWSIVDTHARNWSTEPELCAQWMIESYAREHCDWLNAHQRDEVAS